MKTGPGEPRFKPEITCSSNKQRSFTSSNFLSFFTAFFSRIFSSLENRGYRFLFLAMIGQWISTSILQMTNSLLIYDLTGSALLLGTLALTSSLPLFVLSPFAGSIADRVSKKWLLVFSFASQAVIALVIVLALTTGYLSSARPDSWWLLICTSFLQGVANAFLSPAQRAIILDLVNKEQSTNAVALNTMGQNVLRVIAPAPIGLLIDKLGYGAVFLTLTILYAIGSIFLLFVPSIKVVVGQTRNSLAEVVDGLRYIWRHNILIYILIWSFCGQAAQMVLTRLMPVFSDDILKVGATGMGIWLSAAGIGALISSLFFAYLPPRRRGLLHVLGSITHSLSSIGFAFSRSQGVSTSLMFVQGLGSATGGVMSQSMLQDYTEAGYRGRIFGVHVMSQGLVGMIAFPVVALGGAVGAPWVVAGGSILIIALGVVTLAFNKRYRQLA